MKFTHFDAHTHVQFPAYDEDRDAVIARALDTGIGMINVGADKTSSLAAVTLARKYEAGVYATIGLHPNDTNEGFDYEFYNTLAQDDKVVAIGECGLDFFRIGDDAGAEKIKEAQYELFLKQMKLSYAVQKPLMIHCRNAIPELIEFLHVHKNYLVKGSIMHFFAGTPEEAKKLLELGFYFTFGGVITFVQEYDETVRTIPIDYILSETDAPYVTPAPHRGKRNEPSYVIEVEKKLAELKGVAQETMANQILKNTEKVFGIVLG